MRASTAAAALLAVAVLTPVCLAAESHQALSSAGAKASYARFKARRAAAKGHKAASETVPERPIKLAANRGSLPQDDVTSCLPKAVLFYDAQRSGVVRRKDAECVN